MIYKRHYIQYNDFVFLGGALTSEDDTDVSFKTNIKDYTFGHGGYSPHKAGYSFVKSGSVSITIKLRMKELPCEVRKYYPQFAISQFTKPGKLWAVQNNTLIWAYAEVSNYDTSKDSRTDELEIDIDFELPEGIWHKADKMRTFLLPFDVCDFMDCYNYKDIQPCMTGDCCRCDTPVNNDLCDCCCESPDRDMALCFHMDEIQQFYSCDGPEYRIVYDCEAARKHFGDFYGNEHLGEKFCGNCGVIAGVLYSDTDIPTTEMNITLHGSVKNPYIEINGNGNMIEGEYDGLVIHSDGSVYAGCKECELVSVDKWKTLGNDYGWTIYPGNNRIVIEPGECCGTVCAYIEVDAITI